MRDFLIGLCAIVATAGVVALLFLFDEIDTGGGWSFDIRTNDASGIQTGSQVTLNGVQAGRVSNVQLTRDGGLPVTLSISVDEGIQIPANVSFLVQDSLLGTSARLAMMATSWPEDVPALQDGASLEISRIQSKMMAELGNEIDRRFGTLLASWTLVGERVSSLLGNEQSDEETLTGTLRRFNAVLESTSAWLDDPVLLNSTRDIVQRIPAVLERTMGAAEDLTRLLRTLDTHSQEVGVELAATTRELRRLLDASTALVDTMRAGEGTVGQLMQNPDLYNSLDTAATRLDQLIVDLQLMVDQIREEGVGPLF
jgi:phospholipid/cholesterol/gamma-HCH transport system substrate-binding protein